MSDVDLNLALLADIKPEPAIDVAKFRESDEGKALVSWALSQHKAMKSARQTEERDWKRNYAMYSGKQYIQILRQGQYAGQWIEKPRSASQERKTINRIEPMIRTEISRLTSQKPSASVLPASSDDADMFAAFAGEQVWESHSDRRKFPSVLMEAVFWLCITGNGYIKTYWDESEIDRDSGEQGDVVFENVTPFNVLVPDLRATDIEKQPYLCNYYTKPLSWLKMFYGDALKGIKLTPSSNAANEIIEDSVLNLSDAQKAQPDSCVVYEFWVKPRGHESLPNGGYFVIVDDVLVAYSDSYPYAHGEFPIASVGHLLTGKFYRRSVINSVCDLQKDYNSWRSQLSDARKKMGKPQLTAVKGSVSAARWSNTTGMLIEVRPGFQFPQPLPIAPLPQYIMEEGQHILTDIEDISGQHQVSKGNVPPGVTAATAISYLQEKDDSYLSPTYQSIEDFCQKIARQTLSLVVQFWDIPRLVKVAGDDSQFDALQLSGSDIANGTDIRIEAGSSLPTSKAARQAFVMDLMNAGFVEPDRGLEILEIGGATKLIDQLKTDKRQAQRENIKMKSLTPEDLELHQMNWATLQAQGDPSTVSQIGEPLEAPPVVTVNSWDNHQVHIDTHNLYRRSQAFQFLSDEIKVQFETHVNMHKQMLQQDQLQQMLAGIPSDGSAPGISGIIDPSTGQAVNEPTDGSGQGVPTSDPLSAMGGETTNGTAGE